MRGKKGGPHSLVTQSSPWSSGARLARPAELREASKAAKAEADSAGKAPSPTADPPWGDVEPISTPAMAREQEKVLEIIRNGHLCW